MDYDGSGLKGGATKETREHHPSDGPWSKRNNLSPCTSHTLSPPSFEKQNVLLHSWVHVGRACRRAEETTLHWVTVWQRSSVGGLLLSRGEPADPEVATDTVAPQCSLPWANWKGPVESYRSLSVWGASSRRRTHRSWGVQFISRRPGRQILHRK